MSTTITRKYIKRITKHEGNTSIRQSGSGGGGGGGVSQYWVDDNYVSKEFFNRLFEIHDENGDPILPNDVETEIDNIQAMFGFWTNAYLSALGQNEGGGGAELTLASLADVAVQGVTDGQALVWNATLQKWVPGTGGIDLTAMWAALAQSGTQQIDASHLGTALTGYATETWVGNQGYITGSALNGYATENWVGSQISDMATKTWVSGNYLSQTDAAATYVSIAFFERLFKAYNGSTAIHPNNTTSTIDNIKAMFGFWTDFYLSALGNGSGGSTPGVTMAQVWSALGNSTTEQINISHLTTALSGYNPTSNFKTINGNSIIGTGDIVIQGGGGTVTSIKVGTTLYSPTDGVVSLPAYPTDADTLDGYHASIGNLTFGTIPVITSGGFMDVGNSFEMHYDNSGSVDYSTRLYCTGNYHNSVALPSTTGTLALTSQIPTQVSQLTNDSNYATQSWIGQNYLPLTGGTLTGEITFSYGSSTTDQWIKFVADDNINYFLGVRRPFATYGFSIYDGTTYHRIWHEGNLKNVSQLTNDSGFITSSASITGNAGSATKLQTPRTIWGQSFDGTSNVSGAISGATTISASSNVSVGGTLGVTDATTLSSTLGVTGNTTVGGTLGVTGATTLSSTLSVTSNTTIGGTLGVTDATTLSSTLGVTGNTTVGGTLGVTGATTLSSTLSVSGNATLGGDILMNSGGRIHVKNEPSGASLYIGNSNDAGWVYMSDMCSRQGNGYWKIRSNGNSEFANVYSRGYVTALSDIRHKDIQGDVELTVNEVANAPAVKFLWKDRRQEGLQVGSIAQYWQKVLPEAIVEAADGELTMSYGVIALLASIANAREIVNLRREIAELKRKLRNHGILE